jgi:hypothetical protein
MTALSERILRPGGWFPFYGLRSNIFPEGFASGFGGGRVGLRPADNICTVFASGVGPILLQKSFGCPSEQH